MERVKAGSYRFWLGPLVVAYADKTGTHLDFYPWDWRLVSVQPVSGNPKARACGSEETLRSCRYAIEYAVVPLEERE
jgi:hypothetical protein